MRGSWLNILLPHLLFLAAGIADTDTAGAAVTRPGPNVLLVISDDQGWFEVGVNGNPHIETPVMDRLAGEGVRFTHFYAAPVCSPTRAGLLTGRQFQRTGAIDTYLGRDTLCAGEITLPQLFSERGYRTGLVGKWHLGRYARYHPTARGFDQFFGFWQYGFINRYFDPDELFDNREPVIATGYVTDVLTDRAIDFVRQNRDRPFFLEVAYNAPHAPNDVPDRFIAKYLAKDLPLTDARIYGMITSLDQNLGRLLRAVDDAGLRQETLVIFMSDNGGVSRYYKAGLRGNKASVYEGGIRVPFIVRWPGRFPAGASVDAIAEYVDVFPTLCELIGATVPTDRPIDGASLLPLLRAGGGPSPHARLFRQWTRTRPSPNQNWMARDERYKLANGALFDMRNDPGEEHNIAREYPEKVAQLRSEFERWFADVTTNQRYDRVPIDVGRDDENPVEIDITWAEVAGKKVQPTYRHYNRDTVDSWTEPNDTLRWAINVEQAGRYEVSLSYGCRSEDAGSSFRVSVGAASLTGKVQATAGREIFQDRTIGTLDLVAGPATLEIAPVTIAHGELMTLHKIRLRRVP